MGVVQSCRQPVLAERRCTRARPGWLAWFEVESVPMKKSQPCETPDSALEVGACLPCPGWCGGGGLLSLDRWQRVAPNHGLQPTALSSGREVGLWQAVAEPDR